MDAHEAVLAAFTIICILFSDGVASPIIDLGPENGTLSETNERHSFKADAHMEAIDGCELPSAHQYSPTTKGLSQTDC
jgi:hypothetical protein